MKRVLITGGAGFVGSHLCDELLAQGHRVRVLDNLTSRAHDGQRPSCLSPDVDLVVGDVRDGAAVADALDGIDIVHHLASAVGVGQSMTVNGVGTAVLLQQLIKRPVERLVLASSRSVYGEGLYRDATGAVHEPRARSFERLRDAEWELTAPDGRRLVPQATTEDTRVSPESVYALSKYDQEQMCLMLGAAHDLPVVALRFFNVYGPRQARSSADAGVLPIFASRLLAGQRPRLFEDGQQQRDFVHVHDVARACRAAMTSDGAVGQVINIGSGIPRTVVAIARHLAEIVERPDLRPEITGKHRVGDVRHGFADITRARALLGFKPHVTFGHGLAELANWLETRMPEPISCARSA